MRGRPCSPRDSVKSDSDYDIMFISLSRPLSPLVPGDRQGDPVDSTILPVTCGCCVDDTDSLPNAAAEDGGDKQDDTSTQRNLTDLIRQTEEGRECVSGLFSSAHQVEDLEVPLVDPAVDDMSPAWEPDSDVVQVVDVDAEGEQVSVGDDTKATVTEFEFLVRLLTVCPRNLQ